MYGFDTNVLASRLVNMSYGIRSVEEYDVYKHGQSKRESTTVITRAKRPIYVLPTVWTPLWYSILNSL